jgi:hypothetical protein
LDIAKGIEEASTQFVRCVEVTVVCGLGSCIVPDSFDGIKLGRIGGKQKHLDFLTVFTEPLVHLRLLVIGSVVVNQVETMAASVEGRQQYVFQEIDICGGIEILGLMSVGEGALIKGDRSEDLLCVSLTARGNPGLGTNTSPRLVQSRTLSKRGFVFVDDYTIFFFSFFLRLG